MIRNLLTTGLLVGCLLPVCAPLGHGEETGADLPEMPSVNESSTPPPSTSTSSVPALETTPPTASTMRRLPTAAELEQLRKEKNWMVEGMKSKQEDQSLGKNNPKPNDPFANSIPKSEDMSQAILDTVIYRQKNSPQDNSKPSSMAEKSSSKKSTDSSFQPALSTSALAPLPSQYEGNEEAGISQKTPTTKTASSYSMPNTQGSNSLPDTSSKRDDSRVANAYDSYSPSSSNKNPGTPTPYDGTNNGRISTDSYTASNSNQNVAGAVTYDQYRAQNGLPPAATGAANQPGTNNLAMTPEQPSTQSNNLARMRMEEQERQRQQANRPTPKSTFTSVASPLDAEPF